MDDGNPFLTEYGTLVHPPRGPDNPYTRPRSLDGGPYTEPAPPAVLTAPP